MLPRPSRRRRRDRDGWGAAARRGRGRSQVAVAGPDPGDDASAAVETEPLDLPPASPGASKRDQGCDCDRAEDGGEVGIDGHDVRTISRADFIGHQDRVHVLTAAAVVILAVALADEAEALVQADRRLVVGEDVKLELADADPARP